LQVGKEGGLAEYEVTGGGEQNQGAGSLPCWVSLKGESGQTKGGIGKKLWRVEELTKSGKKKKSGGGMVTGDQNRATCEGGSANQKSPKEKERGSTWGKEGRSPKASKKGKGVP